MGYNHWLPLSFDGLTPYFNSLNSWKLNAKTGEWKVADDNNYVKNGSFEADRRRIPSPVKPVQEYLSGWLTTVIEGIKISLDSTVSPNLNYFNSESDRKFVIGEKSLNISDNINFKRKVSQVITSSPYVKLEDGYYRMTAKVKNSSGFSQLEMYAESNGRSFTKNMEAESSSWKTISIERIAVRDGKVEIGFLATGTANAFCYIDDVSLIKMK